MWISVTLILRTPRTNSLATALCIRLPMTGEIKRRLFTMLMVFERWDTTTATT